jgi:hypothetical protein
VKFREEERSDRWRGTCVGTEDSGTPSRGVKLTSIRGERRLTPFETLLQDDEISVVQRFIPLIQNFRFRARRTGGD